MGISIAQVKMGEKSNEIIAILQLIQLLDIEGCIITIDAIGTKTGIMDKIVKKKADFVLPLRKNETAEKVMLQFITTHFRFVLKLLLVRSLHLGVELTTLSNKLMGL